MVFVEYTNNIFKIDSLNLSEIESLTKQKLNINDFYYTTSGKRSESTLNLLGRNINEKATLYPYSIIKRFADNYKLQVNSLYVLIVGVAFKGHPETIDTRSSASIDLFNFLKSKGIGTYTYDQVIPYDSLLAQDLNPVSDISSSVLSADCVLIMNNHPNNISILQYLKPNKKRLIFDGWSQFNFHDISNIENHVYSTMGFMTS